MATSQSGKPLMPGHSQIIFIYLSPHKPISNPFELTEHLQLINHDLGQDEWTSIWGNRSSIARRVYKQFIGRRQTHTVFLWLVLKDRINTRYMLRRKGMHLDSFVYELCILQRLETRVHLMICNFAKAYWASIRVSYTSSRPVF